MDGIREDWFPTSIWYFDLEQAKTLNPQLLESIREVQHQNSQGMTGRSNVLGWHSQDTLHQHPDFQSFTSYVRQAATEVATFLRWDLSQSAIAIINCWAIVNDKYAHNRIHNHANSLLSGVYYVKAPPNCGSLFFRDPRETALMINPPVMDYTQWTFKEVIYQPVEGRMLIFPSWLLHGVAPNKSDESRVCLSFNLGLQK